jgi:hypothetical protein
MMLEHLFKFVGRHILVAMNQAVIAQDNNHLPVTALDDFASIPTSLELIDRFLGLSPYLF